METSRSTKKEIAKYYLEELGWSLIPMNFIEDDGDTVKRPMVKWKKYQMEKPTLKEVYEWINKDWFLGVVTGTLSGIDVVDDDRGKKGLEPLKAVSLVTAKTRSGGFHHYYRHKPGMRNTQGGKEHVDIRGEGGYVVLPPFEDYEWVKKPSKKAVAGLVYIDDSLVEKAKDTEYKTVGEAYDLSSLINVEKGGRDDNMYRLGLRMCNSFPEKDWKTVLELMHISNSTYKPPLAQKIVEEKFKQAATFVKNNPYEEKGQLDAKKVMQQFPVQTYSQMGIDKIKQKQHRELIPVGIDKIDSFFKFPTGYYVICANPGAGKGWFALWMIRQHWVQHRKKSVFFSLEMPEILVRTRIQQQWSDLTQEGFEGGGDVGQAIDLMQQDVLIVDEFYAGEQKLQTPEMFQAKIDYYYDKGYRIFHFDHLHELDGANDNGQNQKVTELWGSTFQKISKDKPDIWLFIFAQPNGAAALKTFITRTDISGSKAITQKCDFFISLNRTVKKNTEGIVEVESEDRSVLFFLDKSRYTSVAHVGARIHFAHNGNFYKDDSSVIVVPAKKEASKADLDLISDFL